MRPTGVFLALLVAAGVPAPAVSAQEPPPAPQEPQAAQPPKLAGTEVPVPKRTKTVPPEYPPEAQAQGLRGIVILELIVDAGGKVSSASVLRSVPPFDEAALIAARQWEYEVTRVDGKPVSVRLTVPISFAMKIPAVTRQAGIPELRQGVSPPFPRKGEKATVTAEVTLQPDGRVAEAQIETGESPWSEALLQALRTWRFAIEGGDSVISFRVRADFIPGPQAHVDLQLSDLRRSAAPSENPPAAAPRPPGPEVPGVPSPSPSAEPSPAPPPEPAIPAPASGAPPRPAPRGPPPIEVITAPTPRPTSAVGDEPAVSAVRDVTLSLGVPELVKGRRPVVPPLARMAGVDGTVEVRFAVDAAGVASVQTSDGPDLLKRAAEQTVASWSFRRSSAERLHLVAEFTYHGDSAAAAVRAALE